MIGNKRKRLLTEQNFGDIFEATGLLFLEILAKNQQILMKTAFIFENKNPTASKLSPIDSKLNFTYKMFLK